jgi:hypothetical protein
MTSNLIGGESLSYAAPGVGYRLAIGWAEKAHLIFHLVVVLEMLRGVAIGIVLSPRGILGSVPSGGSNAASVAEPNGRIPADLDSIVRLGFRSGLEASEPEIVLVGCRDVRSISVLWIAAHGLGEKGNPTVSSSGGMNPPCIHRARTDSCLPQAGWKSGRKG